MPPHDSSDAPYRLVTEVPAEGVVLARLHGRVDYVGAPMLRRELFALVDSAARLLLLDLVQVTLLSAAAMEMMLAIDIHAGTSGCELRVIATTRAVLRPLSLAGLDERIKIYDSLDHALHA